MFRDNYTFPISIEFTQKKPSGFFRYIFWMFLGVVIIGMVTFVAISRPPKQFVPDTIITVYPGMSSQDLATLLENNHIITSSNWFRVLFSTKITGANIVVGDYIFEKPESVLSVLHRINRGIYGNGRIKVTFPEGVTIKNMADILGKQIPDFNVSEFIAQAKNYEGFLFPETYYFFRTTQPEQVITALQNEFIKTINELDVFNGQNITNEPVYGKNRSIRDIIIMASILEREAKNAEEAKIISGILWKRLAIGMPLQVDATFLYTIQKGSSQLTLQDLRTDGPYNTYTRKGLPVGPIGNPGKAMIIAALNPVESEYLFYLHDDSGKIYYGKNFQEHTRNKQKYLR